MARPARTWKAGPRPCAAAVTAVLVIACAGRERVGGGTAGTTGAAGAGATAGRAGVSGAGGMGGPAGMPGGGAGTTAGTGDVAGTGNMAGASGSSGMGGASGGGGAAAPGGAGGMGGPSGRDASIGGDGPGSADAAADAGTDTAAVAKPPAAIPPLPSAEQLAWQRQELTAFFHFGTNTFDNQEVGDGTASPSIFNPSALDASQWIDAIKSAGFGQGMLVAKHHDGFCLWPTKYTTYSVKQSPWKGGQGDVVREFTTAAHAANIRVGLYLSPWDQHEATYGTPAYNTFFKNLLTELLSNYGVVDEIWFDGNKAPTFDWKAVYDLVRQLQPHTLIAITGPDIRWVGTEDGIAPAGETSVQAGSATVGQMAGPVWYPAEADLSIRPGWFWHAAEDTQVKTSSQLLDVYYGSVGRNSVMLLNLPPDTRGLLASPDLAALGQFGSAVRSIYQTNLAAGKAASADSVYGSAPDFGAAMAIDGKIDTFWAAALGKTTGRLEIDLGARVTFNVVSLQEPIELGERATAYHVEVQQTGGWVTIATGTVIGERNLLRVASTTAQKIALVIDGARGVPAIAELGVFRTP